MSPATAILVAAFLSRLGVYRSWAFVAALAVGIAIIPLMTLITLLLVCVLTGDYL
ncbi:MAG: hypothetical protein JSS27_14710 [Planctomycetes bacterium]|nr:hypothetical protein [Planctomycetota bacterium]